MDYFGIKTPQRDNEAPYIWWIANSRHEAWMSFFQYPSAKREMNAHRLPLAEAIQAYEAIGYRCIALDVQEKPNVLGEGPPERRSRGGNQQAQLVGGPSRPAG